MILASVVNQEDFLARRELLPAKTDADFFEELAQCALKRRLSSVNSSAGDRKSGLVRMADDQDLIFALNPGLKTEYDVCAMDGRVG